MWSVAKRCPMHPRGPARKGSHARARRAAAAAEPVHVSVGAEAGGICTPHRRVPAERHHGQGDDGARRECHTRHDIVAHHQPGSDVDGGVQAEGFPDGGVEEGEGVEDARPLWGGRWRYVAAAIAAAIDRCSGDDGRGAGGRPAQLAEALQRCPPPPRQQRRQRAEHLVVQPRLHRRAAREQEERPRDANRRCRVAGAHKR